jgi:hypothetical protein
VIRRVQSERQGENRGRAEIGAGPRVSNDLILVGGGCYVAETSARSKQLIDRKSRAREGLPRRIGYVRLDDGSSRLLTLIEYS